MNSQRKLPHNKASSRERMPEKDLFLGEPAVLNMIALFYIYQSFYPLPWFIIHHCPPQRHRHHADLHHQGQGPDGDVADQLLQ